MVLILTMVFFQNLREIKFIIVNYKVIQVKEKFKQQNSNLNNFDR